MADRERTILLPEQSETIGSLLPRRLLRKVKQTFLQIQPEKRGLSGDIFSLSRSNQPPITIDWEMGYKRGAGKSLKSKILEGRNFTTGKGIYKTKIRGKRGPRFNIKIRF